MLAWLLGRTCFEDRHYVFVSEAFYPHRLPNPRSSSPLAIFMDLYQAALDRDPFDKVISQYRISLVRGVRQRLQPGSPLRPRLIEICNHGDPALFWPVILVVSRAAAARGVPTISSSLGSRETLIPNLHGDEFDILTFDETRLPLGHELLAQAFAGAYDHRDGAVHLLRDIDRCQSL
ncbi:MAG: hypothetical protein GVY28_09940 [Alphaproteobacteria bacterium]|jgi:hypothetical protein|nr:hypothetical protein [Alphaproteobacteria bacterium]